MPTEDQRIVVECPAAATEACRYEPPTSNGDTFMKRSTSLLVIVAMFFGAYMALERKIDAAVKGETVLREKADARIVDELKMIKYELNEQTRELIDLNKWLRDHSNDIS